jgi:hypothetical protein
LSLLCKLGLHKNKITHLEIYVNTGDMWEAGFTLYYKFLKCQRCGAIHKKEIPKEKFWKLEEMYFVEVVTI